MAPGLVTSESQGHLLTPLCSAAGLLLLLCSLCTLCKRRKKRRMRNVCSSGVALVDVTLLRQTQLRSLSKSDTKLHEIKRPRPGDPYLRPVSMDPLYHCPQWPVPNASSTEDATYSNLNYNPKNSLYECVGSREDKEPSLSKSQVNVVTAEYACVRKVKKAQDTREEEKTQPPAPSQEPCLQSRSADLILEDMYSKVQKKKRPTGTQSTEGLIKTSIEDVIHPEFPICQPEENLYESISDMGSHHTNYSKASDTYA
ncbi:lck-interacting transmembrane adapter 1 isoform X1 [Bufo bufo]|uniref:lck-interacting transmembrane adapter 1 isoform X1 n=2 Tax=Bufo bufo TaxID=8384 RepID=UPI001ABDBE06|nr:lck-interacting transmembrane adapter 1 isoform X1 [Bufo bufo]